MSETYSDNAKYPKNRVDLDGGELRALCETADAFICAAGFESRARRAPLSAPVQRNPIVIHFKNGPEENEPTLKQFIRKFHKIPGYNICELDWNHVEAFEKNFEETLGKIRDVRSGEILLDISSLPNFAICICVIKIRKLLPTIRLKLLYTEAEDYFPTKAQYADAKRAKARRPSDLFPGALSAKVVSMFMPTMFSGLTLGHNDTCLIVFPGYEPHRTCCVIEALNPSKLVMLYGKPERKDLQWRLDLSRTMHTGIEDLLIKTEEICPTYDVDTNLRLLLSYYEHLYDDHVISISPINSKLQTVAAALAWETYPDIQLNFPIPAQYLATRFSAKSRDTFLVDLKYPTKTALVFGL